MAKILTMTIFMKPKGVKDWKGIPSFAGKVILGDDMRIYGFVDEFCSNRRTPAIKCSVEGAAIKHEKLKEEDPDEFSLGFHIMLNGVIKHALSSTLVVFNRLSNGYYGDLDTTEHDTTKFIHRGDIRINVSPYISGMKDVSTPDESALAEISQTYQTLIGLTSRDEQSHTSAAYWHQVATA